MNRALDRAKGRARSTNKKTPQGGRTAIVLAPDIDQREVIDHHHGSTVEGETRNVRTEAARIARGRYREGGRRDRGGGRGVLRLALIADLVSLLALGGCGEETILDYAGRESEAPGEVLMTALGDHMGRLRRVGMSLDDSGAARGVMSEDVAAIVRYLELSRKMKGAGPFQANLDRNIA